MPEQPNPPAFTLSLSGTKAMLVAIAGHVLTAVGVILVAKGFATQGQVDAAVPGLAEQIVGLLLTAGSAVWSAYRTKHANNKAVAALTDPTTVNVVK